MALRSRSFHKHSFCDRKVFTRIDKAAIVIYVVVYFEVFYKTARYEKRYDLRSRTSSIIF